MIHALLVNEWFGCDCVAADVDLTIGQRGIPCPALECASVGADANPCC